MGVSFSVDPDGAGDELDRLAAGPDTGRFESILLAGFMETAAKVHVITGELKASGRPESSYDGGRWEGTIAFARHPGVFELARGDAPTKNHPEGEHFFFDPAGENYLDAVKREMDEFVSGGEAD
jgi:hypothetical protein